jgi:hypothetical protein
VRIEWPDLVATEDCKFVAAHVMDIGEYLANAVIAAHKIVHRNQPAEENIKRTSPRKKTPREEKYPRA